MSLDAPYINLARSYFFKFDPNYPPPSEKTLVKIAKDIALINSDEYYEKSIKSSHLPYTLRKDDDSSLTCSVLRETPRFMDSSPKQKRYFIREICANIYQNSSFFDKDFQQVKYQKFVGGAQGMIQSMLADKCDFNAVLQKTAKIRSKIAYNLYHSELTQFGKPRSGLLISTGLHNLAPKSEEIARNFIQDPSRPFEYINEYDDIHKWKGQIDINIVECREKTITFETDQGTIPLTNVIYEKYRHPRVFVIHTKPEFIHPILEVAEKVFNRIQTEKLSTEELFVTVGELHWLLSQATAFFRGSAAISEMICGAILNKDCKRVLVGRPDVVALVSPDIAEFSKNYKEFWKDS